ncbi:hypothetical protein HDU99_010558, partial [Rhizoclosmatium hyalinum]
YKDYGIRNLGLVINHDDTIEAKNLTTKFDETAIKWKFHFGSAYSAYIKESNWFRLPTPAVYPDYAIKARENAVTITRPTRVVPDGQGGCACHDPTPMPDPNRRSLARFPINAPINIKEIEIHAPTKKESGQRSLEVSVLA